jgi:hypothetical protein
MSNMGDPEPKRRGRPRAFSLERKETHEIHLRFGVEIWTTLRDYSEETGELSLSMAVRRIVRTRLIELGYVKEKVHLFPQSHKSP